MPGLIRQGVVRLRRRQHVQSPDRRVAQIPDGPPDLIHVPYRGAGPALTDVISGQIPMIIPAMTGSVRTRIPEVRTRLAVQGLDPGIVPVDVELEERRCSP